VSFLVILSEKPEDRPKWFRDKYRDLLVENIMFGNGFRDKPWTWYWNDKYEHKVRLRQGRIHIDFENEEMYTWFILKEL
jgi:hypothetical protein